MPNDNEVITISEYKDALIKCISALNTDKVEAV